MIEIIQFEVMLKSIIGQKELACLELNLDNTNV